MSLRWASSFGAAVNAYTGGGGITEGIATGIIKQAWQGTGRENIQAKFAVGQNAGKGFNIGFTMASNSISEGSTLPDVLVGSMFMTNEKIMDLFQNGSAQGGGGGTDFSLAGMYAHFQFGGGNPMTLNMSSIDFSGTSQRELGLTGMTVGKSRPVNLFNAGATNSAALAFGRVNMMYHGNNQFSIVSDNSSRFDFSPIYDPGASWGRNAGNILGTMINYNLMPGTPFSPLVPLIFGGPYKVNFYGTTTIPR